jgi:hypothetical protein
VGTVTSLRRVGGYAGAGLAGLACLTWILVTLNVIVLGTVGSLVVSAVCAAGFGAESAGRLKAVARLCKQGRITDATIVSLDERFVSIQGGFNGWMTMVKVSFTDATGHLINAGYTDYARAKGKREGQMVQIAYDPSRPVSIAPVGGDGDPRIIEAVFLALGSAVSAGIAVYFAVRAFG